MKRIWNVINEIKIKKVVKNKLYLGVLIFVNIVIGGAIWLILGRMILPETGWLLCFMGYPAIFVGSLVEYSIYTIMSLHNFYQSFTYG